MSVSVIGTLTAILLLLPLIEIGFQALQLAIQQVSLRAVVISAGITIALAILLAVIGGYYYNWRWTGVGGRYTLHTS
jgi:small-conductance mechanosensitive channel